MAYQPEKYHSIKNELDIKPDWTLSKTRDPRVTAELRLGELGDEEAVIEIQRNDDDTGSLTFRHRDYPSRIGSASANQERDDIKIPGKVGTIPILPWDSIKELIQQLQDKEAARGLVEDMTDGNKKWEEFVKDHT